MTKKKRNIAVGEPVRIAVSLAIKKFQLTDDQKELELPSSFSAQERAYVHNLCVTLGLKSKSRGKRSNRYLTVYKNEGSTIVQADASFGFTRSSHQHTVSLLQRYPVNARERQDLLPPTDRDRLLGQECRDVNRTTGRLNNGIPQVPPWYGESGENQYFRRGLPIWQYRDDILQALTHHQVILIMGETGCGKTTQVPQYILEQAHSMSQPCRIICTQPRRIAALSVAERVSLEREEKIGQTIGYQIRLESRVSPKTLLTFCTNGVLLRTLMGGDSALATVTHIIVDELHERDRFSDFLLVVMRDMLQKFRNLKLILMSATLDVQLFVKYFGGCPVIEVPGKLFKVETFFLENILSSTNYMTKLMMEYKKSQSKNKAQRQSLDSWCFLAPGNSGDAQIGSNEAASLEIPSISEHEYFNQMQISNLNEKVIADLDDAILDAWSKGTDDSFMQLLHILLSEGVSVDYKHSETSASALMVAAGRGKIEIVEQLLSLGASVNLKASNEWTALDWALRFDQKEVLDLLSCSLQMAVPSSMGDQPVFSDDYVVSEEDKERLNIYQHCFNDDNVDLNLILTLLYKIHTEKEEGAILVFLPGYDDIVTLRDKILTDEKHFSDSSRYILYTLHSNMQSSDQKRIFKTPPPGCRKIILSTNIAETSITINDVVFVIDSGKVKEKSFDALTGVTTLQATWISQASAIQRRGRSGRCRPGKCFHLFSQNRFSSLQQYTIPEILRLPIHELCLQAKLLAPPNIPIADFLARAPDPPPFMMTRNAVTLLKTIDALDPWEELTELGLHLLDLPIEPHLGKMVLYSVVLKCLDPILTIVSSLACRDPFSLPSHPSQKQSLVLTKKRLAADTFSDHMCLLRAFQAWQKARNDGNERSFCEKNFISIATMEMIVGMRTQLLGQLRASGFVRARGGGDIRDLNTNSENWAVVKAALCAGTYPNFIRVDLDRKQLITQKESKVRFHVSSVLSKVLNNTRQTISEVHGQTVSTLPCDWLVYEEMTRVGRFAHARCCTLVSPITVALFGGPARLPLDALHEPEYEHMDGYAEESDSENEEKNEVQKSLLKLDEWVSFRVEPEVARMAIQLRQKWHALFLRRMHAPAKPWSQVDEAVVRTIINVLSAEEQAIGLQQPSGIGQRPRPMTNEFCPAVMSGSSASGGSRTTSPVGGMPSQPYARFAQDLRQNIASEVGCVKDFDQFTTGSKGSPRRGILEKKTSKSSDDRSDTSSINSGASGTCSDPITPCGSPARFNPCVTREKILPASSSPKRFFVIKANNPKLIEITWAAGIWAFSPSVERKLQWALAEGKEVILVFSLRGSDHFQGYARMTSETVNHKPNEFMGSNLSPCYVIEWLKKCHLPFQMAKHLQNPWNLNRKVQDSRDGQELEPNIGTAICSLFENLVPLLNVQSQPSEYSVPPLYARYNQWSTTSYDV